MFTLTNGVRVVTERLPHFRSVAAGIWIGAGSVREADGQRGVSHFIEHMLFKGTSRRSAQDIAIEMDALGGMLNAFTAKECTCYYSKVMDNHLDSAVDLLCDMALNPRLDSADIEKEKGVVLEEILMVEDDPEDLVHEVLTETFYGDNPLGARILGTKESVSAFTAEDLRAYMAEYYAPGNMHVAVAGSFDEKRLQDVLEDKLSSLKPVERDWSFNGEKRETGRKCTVREKDIEQLHIALALPGFSITDDRYYTLLVLNNVLGGSMSSRLFQKIREEKGLAYSVYSYTSSYQKSGALGLYAGTNSSQGENVFELMLEEMRLITKGGVTKEEFLRSKEQLKGNYVLSSESTSSRMTSIGKSMLLFNKVMTEEEVFERIERVTWEDVNELGKVIFDTGDMSGAFVGRSVKSREEWMKGW